MYSILFSLILIDNNDLVVEFLEACTICGLNDLYVGTLPLNTYSCFSFLALHTFKTSL